MSQNRNTLINKFVGNISNSIVHKILEGAIHDEILSNRYTKEIRNSFEIAKIYREKINPINSALPFKDIQEIKDKISKKVKMELRSRISLGYKNIDLSSVETEINNVLEELKVI